MTNEDVRSGAGGELDTSAAMVRAESGHLDATLRALVTRLSAVPGLQMAVSYRHGRMRRLIGDLPYVNDLHRGGAPIERLTVTVGARRHSLRSRSGVIECATDDAEPMPFAAWASDLFDAIAEQNLANHASILALRRLVEQDRVD